MLYRGLRTGLTSLKSAYILSQNVNPLLSAVSLIESSSISTGNERFFLWQAQPTQRSWQKQLFSRHSLWGVHSSTFHSAEQAIRPELGNKRFHASQDKVDAKAQVVFDTCWRRLETKLAGKLQVPKEIVWLNGAPGSGKGVNTPFIQQSRGLSRAVAMSSLLQHNASIRELMDKGELVPDTMVGDAVLDVIFDPEHADSAGLIIDGFPRTALQVEFLKLLYDKMMALHVEYADTPDEWRFPRPSFKIVVLYVEMEESIRRQIMRARMASLHNKRVLDAGAGDLQDVRPTDADMVKCRRRYEVFKLHYGTLLRLKQYFPFSLIDAMGTLEECRAQIAREMRYQSSMDLDEGTYSAIRHLPLARELVRTSRQQLVSHLDGYCRKYNDVFMRVIKVIDNEALPTLKRCSLAGHAELKTHNKLFSEHPIAADMFMDILTDRGFAVAYFIDEQVIPLRVNMQSGDIENRVETVHHFRITFESQKVRDAGAAATASSPEAVDAARKGLAIGTSFVPPHLDHQRMPPTLREPALPELSASTPIPDLERKPEVVGSVEAVPEGLVDKLKQEAKEQHPDP